MSRTKLRGFFLFAAALSLLNVARAADSYTLSLAEPGFGAVDLGGGQAPKLSSDSIDRYMQTSATSAAPLATAESSTDYADDAPLFANAGVGLSQDTTMLVAFGVCVALGVALCLTGVVLARRRALGAGTAGLLRIQ